MCPALSFHHAAYASAGAVRRAPKQAGSKSAMRRRKSPRALVGVPMLDWPSSLFSDDVGEAEDFELQWDLPGAVQHTGIHRQATA